MCIFVFAYLCVCGHKHMFPGMRLFVRKGLCVHPFCARFHPMVCCARIHSTTFTCGPRPRASLHPNLGQGDILSQISRRRPGSFSTQGQDPSYLRDQGWVQSRECSFEKAPCIIYQIFRIRVPNRSGSAWPSKGILDVHNLGSEDDVQLWNPCCSLRAS